MINVELQLENEMWSSSQTNKGGKMCSYEKFLLVISWLTNAHFPERKASIGSYKIFFLWHLLSICLLFSGTQRYMGNTEEYLTWDTSHRMFGAGMSSSPVSCNDPTPCYVQDQVCPGQLDWIFRHKETIFTSFFPDSPFKSALPAPLASLQGQDL